MAIPDPANVAPWYLRNITQALALDEATGNVYLRTGFTGDIIIEGNVNIPGEIDTHISSVGTLGNISTPYLPIGGNVTAFQGTSPWIITGNTNAVVSGTVAATQSGVWTVNVQDGGNSITVDGTVAITGNIAGITSNVTVIDGGGSLTVDGNVNATVTGGNVAVTSIPDTSVTAWQEPYGITITPVIQYDASYGLTPLTDQDIVAISTNGNGNVSSSNSVFYVSSGNTTGDLASLRSSRHIPYRSGQGCLARFTAAFTEGVANSNQRAGMTNGENVYMFGYQGNTYGIIHAYNGQDEIRTLTINTAPTGSQTANITLNGTSYSVPIAAGTAANTAATIATWSGWPDIWRLDQSNANVTFTALNPGARSGTYSFSSTGSGTLATGTFAQNQAGAAVTIDFVPKSSWNGTPLPVTFSPQDLNVYQIQMKWLGAGAVKFAVENPDTGTLQTVHTQKWVATGNVFPHASKPNMRVGWTAAASGTLASPMTVAGSSAMGAVEGVIQQNSYSIAAVETDTTTRAQNNLWHVLSLRNPNQKFNQQNTQELVLQDISFSFQGNDPVVIYLFINARASGNLIYQPVNTTQILKSTTAGVTIDLNTYVPVATFTAPVTGSAQFNLIPYRIILPPGQECNVGFFSTGQVTRTSCSITTSING